MFRHVTIRARDRDASARFYDTVLQAIGIERTLDGPADVRWGDFRLAAASATEPVTQRVHVGFGAASRDHVDAFWRAGTAAGYRDDGAPGLRPQYGGDYYGGFLLDPDGNSAEAVHHGSLREGGHVDHVWIRVADVAAAKAFYESIADRAGFRLTTDTPARAQFAGGSGSFSLVAGTPSENAEMGFGAPEALSVRDPDGNRVELVADG